MPSKTARPEGERWFEWPLTPTSIGMTAAELISELYETVTALNHDRSWNLTLVAPARFGDIIIDREAGCLRAKCAWKAKDPSQLGPEPDAVGVARQHGERVQHDLLGAQRDGVAPAEAHDDDLAVVRAQVGQRLGERARGRGGAGHGRMVPNPSWT